MDERIRSLRGSLRIHWNELDSITTDQQRKIPVPPQELPVPQGAPVFDLVQPAELPDAGMTVLQAIRARRSRRSFSGKPLTKAELSLLLYATQGVRDRREKFSFRTVPSGGARHPFETYLSIARVEGFEPGLYRYLPLSHRLVLLRRGDQTRECVKAILDQGETAAVTFFWTAVPYRTEWRYSVVSHKIIALDAGHICQNLYLACESIGCGTCGIGAYDQEKADAFLGVDGEDEFLVYAAIVGKPAAGED